MSKNKAELHKKRQATYERKKEVILNLIMVLTYHISTVQIFLNNFNSNYWILPLKKDYVMREADLRGISSILFLLF